MLGRWYYSLWMLLAYVGVFAVWKVFPSRPVFALIGGSAVVFLSVTLIRAKRNGYFTNRIDLYLHAYVILDLVLESSAFELLRLVEPHAVVGHFHDNFNFFGCTLAFVCLIGGYRWFKLRRWQRADGAAYGQAGV